MIKSFSCKETKGIFEGFKSRKFPYEIQKNARTKIDFLDQATCLNDIAFLPSNRLEKLHGNRKNQYSIRINQQWRICFEWDGKDLHEVEITDYH